MGEKFDGLLDFIIIHIAGKLDGGRFGDFDESLIIHQTKTIQISVYNYCNNLLADLLIHQTFFAICSKTVNSPNFPPPKFLAILYDIGKTFAVLLLQTTFSVYIVIQNGSYL